MTLSPKELSAGQQAYERLDAFQRQKPIQSLLVVLILMGSEIWRAFDRDGWKVALEMALFCSLIGVIGIYQFRKQKTKAEESALLLAKLKATYGEKVYSEIEKSPHSFFYNIFVRCYPPFKRRSVKLP